MCARKNNPHSQTACLWKCDQWLTVIIQNETPDWEMKGWKRRLHLFISVHQSILAHTEEDIWVHDGNDSLSLAPLTLLLQMRHSWLNSVSSDLGAGGLFRLDNSVIQFIKSLTDSFEPVLHIS